MQDGKPLGPPQMNFLPPSFSGIKSLATTLGAASFLKPPAKSSRNVVFLGVGQHTALRSVYRHNLDSKAGPALVIH